MTTTHYYGLARPGYRSTVETISTAFTSGFDTVRRYFRMRRAVAELTQLDDRMLKDIGLSRSTLHASALEVHGFGGYGHDGR